MVAGVVKEIVVLIVSRLECVARTAILSGVAWVGSPGRLSRITRILGIMISRYSKCTYGN